MIKKRKIYVTCVVLAVVSLIAGVYVCSTWCVPHRENADRIESDTMPQNIQPAPLPNSQRVDTATTMLMPTGTIDHRLVADYYTGDGMGYNLDLSLLADGTYSCTWTGCMGPYGNASGVWARSGDSVSFINRESTGALTNYLRGATVVDGGRFPALVLEQGQEYYRKYGLDEYSALQRERPSLR